MSESNSAISRTDEPIAVGDRLSHVLSLLSWHPPGVDPHKLCYPLQRVLVDLIEPVYQQLVIQTASAMERSIGMTICHLLWAEAIEQINVATPPDPKSKRSLFRFGGENPREKEINRHLHLVHTKLKASSLLLKIRQYKENYPTAA